MKRILLDSYTDHDYWQRDTFVEDVDGTHIHTEYNDGALVDQAKILADQPPGKDFRHAAVIPQSVMDRAAREGWLHDKAAWKAWANDPDNKDLRTWNGRL